jgi:hypothetical protein
MTVPTTGSFLMFGTGSNTTIAGAIIQGGASSETVASTLNFNALKALANINKFDAEFKEGATTLEQIVKSTQFRGYPISLPDCTLTGIAYLPLIGNKELILNVYNATTESIDYISVNYNFEDSPNIRVLNTVSGFSPPVYYYISGSEIPVGNSTYKIKMNVTASYTSSALIYDVEPDSNSFAQIYTISASFFTDGTPRDGGGVSSPTSRRNAGVSADTYFNPTTWTTMSLDITASYSSPPTTTTTTTTVSPFGRSWSSGGALLIARRDLAGAGTQNAGLAFGGNNGYPNTAGARTEEYNGTLWLTSNNLITGRQSLAGAGEQNAALAFGGGYGTLSCTEEYDGSSWSTGGALINGRQQLAGAGTQTAGLAFGGIQSPFFITSVTEEYNGTSWSAGGALITGRATLVGAGTQNVGLAFGGSFSVGGTPIAASCTEEYNGTSWSIGGTLITGRQCLSGVGTQNEALAFGGAPTTIGIDLSCTEEYNGSSWSAGGALINARESLAGAGTQTAGLAFGGHCTGIPRSCTEEYS